MPNHCTNTLTFYGTMVDLARLREHVAGETSFDFEKILPMPATIRDTVSGTESDLALLCARDDGTRTALGVYATYAWAKDYQTVRELVGRYKDEKYAYDRLVAKGKQLLENEARYGAKTWYEWALANWGTKWNAYGDDLKERGRDQE